MLEDYSTENSLRDSETAAEPFPLTEIQEAYWIGEKNAYLLSTPAFVHRTFIAAEIDIEKLRTVLLTMLIVHPILRLRVLDDGTQIIAPPPIDFDIPLRNLNQVTLQEQLSTASQNYLLPFLPALDSGCQFSCFIDKTISDYRIHFLLRLIAIDGRSSILFFRDLVARYTENEIINTTHKSYEDYVRYRVAVKNSAAYQVSWQYWLGRLQELPDAPHLPIVDYGLLPKCSTFQRKQFRLNKIEIAELNRKAKLCGVTTNILFCTLFTDILRMWSRNKHFTLNILTSLRPTDDSDYATMLGNFTSTLLLEIPYEGKSFKERAIAIQKRFYKDYLKHSQISGIEVIRAMRRTSNVPVMPITFAYLLGDENESQMGSYQDLGWHYGDSSLQTPQVWLDHQVFRDQDELVLNWDYVVEVFLPDVIEQMYFMYRKHILTLLQEDCFVDEPLLPILPNTLLRARIAANNTTREISRELLHDFYQASCRHYMDKTAIIASDRTLSYRSLWSLTTRLATVLRTMGIGCNDLVAILADRGWQQVAAVIAVVQAGGAYLPITSELPLLRKNYLLAQTGIKILLVQRCLQHHLSIPNHIQVLFLDDLILNFSEDEIAPLLSIQQPEDLAYVIFTSGSTGQPKGVAIDHRSAVNTIQDVINRFGITAHDRAIAISAFNFDLSVFDIFGVLGCGATLIIPPHSDIPSPGSWAKCVREHQVTIWNSVPAFLEMQIEYCLDHPDDLATLRLVMLSGDWIPLSLPKQLINIVPEATLISLGGATEASIWSNYFIIDEIDPSWKSIPYGWPLSNQVFHVLDQHLEPAPTWVSGQLYIGGEGLARCYYNDPAKTAEKFILHPKTGERLYQTGDLGRYYPNGCLEFLGREDNQVKIRGFRIELGEIEAVLEQFPYMRSAAVIAREINESDRQLVCFYTAEQANIDNQISILARAFLEQYLPSYMVPSLFIMIEKFPITVNGKINRNTLQQLAKNHINDHHDKLLPRDKIEQRLVELWSMLLELESVGIEENFFALGGSSLLAVRILNTIEQEFGQRLPLASLFSDGTIAAQAKLLRDVISIKQSAPIIREPLVTICDGVQDILLAIHPVGGNVFCYQQLTELVPQGTLVVGIQSPGTGQDRSILDLAQHYCSTFLNSVATHNRALHLLGWSMGGVIAHEMVHFFECNYQPVASLSMIDSWTGDHVNKNNVTDSQLLLHFISDLFQGRELPTQFTEIINIPEEQQILKTIELLRIEQMLQHDISDQLFAELFREYCANYRALIMHQPSAINSTVYQYSTKHINNRFPFLTPFKFDHSRNRYGLILDEDHFSIMRTDCLKRIILRIPWRGLDENHY